jgi:hypothetical protein
MAHFAKLDENNIVVQVIVAGDEYESTGEQLYAETVGGVWKRTSYNTVSGTHRNNGTAFRGNYAGIGFTYDETLDAFIPPKPFNSWVLNESIFNWVPPIPVPDASTSWMWDEENQTWVEPPSPQE